MRVLTGEGRRVGCWCWARRPSVGLRRLVSRDCASLRHLGLAWHETRRESSTHGPHPSRRVALLFAVAVLPIAASRHPVQPTCRLCDDAPSPPCLRLMSSVQVHRSHLTISTGHPAPTSTMAAHHAQPVMQRWRCTALDQPPLRPVIRRQVLCLPSATDRLSPPSLRHSP